MAAAGATATLGSALRERPPHPHEAWTGDSHRHALAPPDAATVVGCFDPHAPFTSSGTHAEAREDGDRYLMKAEDREGVLRSFGIDFVIGGRRIEDSLTRLPKGRLQVVPISFHVTGTPGAKPAWGRLPTHKQSSLPRDHPFPWTNDARSFNNDLHRLPRDGSVERRGPLTYRHRMGTGASPR